MTTQTRPYAIGTRVDRPAVPGNRIPALVGTIVDRAVVDDPDTDEFLGYCYRIELDRGGFVKSTLHDGI